MDFLSAEISRSRCGKPDLDAIKGSGNQSHWPGTAGGSSSGGMGVIALIDKHRCPGDEALCLEKYKSSSAGAKRRAIDPLECGAERPATYLVQRWYWLPAAALSCPAGAISTAALFPALRRARCRACHRRGVSVPPGSSGPAGPVSPSQEKATRLLHARVCIFSPRRGGGRICARLYFTPRRARARRAAAGRTARLPPAYLLSARPHISMQTGVVIF